MEGCGSTEVIEAEGRLVCFGCGFVLNEVQRLEVDAWQASASPALMSGRKAHWRNTGSALADHRARLASCKAKALLQCRSLCSRVLHSCFNASTRLQDKAVAMERCVLDHLTTAVGKEEWGKTDHVNRVMGACLQLECRVRRLPISWAQIAHEIPGEDKYSLARQYPEVAARCLPGLPMPESLSVPVLLEGKLGQPPLCDRLNAESQEAFLQQGIQLYAACDQVHGLGVGRSPLPLAAAILAVVMQGRH